MSELRLQGKNNEGTHITLADNDGNEFTLRISDTLRATINQPRLAAVPTSDEEVTITVKEIQRRLRAGDAPEVIAREGNTTVDKVARFSGPILQEREYILNQARSAGLRKDSTRLDISFLDAVVNKLVPRGVDADDLSWNTWRLPDATWHIELHYPNRDGNGVASWNFDTSRRTINPTDDNGAWLIGEDAPARVIEPGFISAEPTHPSRIETVAPVAPVELPGANSLFSPVAPVEEKPETPRLVAIRDTPTAADAEDGVTARAKIPSWDEIMFGSKAPAAPSDEESEEQ
jgi:hypothetical protein